MTSYLILLGLCSLLIGGAVIAVQLVRHRMFSMLTFAAGLFLLESAGGALKALMPDVFPDYSANDASNPLPYVPHALMMYIVGFILFIYGYAIITWLLRVNKQHRENVTDEYFKRVWTPSYRILLILVTLFALATGFVQQFQRVRSVGGLADFKETAFQHRWGTATEGAGETAVVVMANLASGSAVAFAVIWLIAWLRGRLTLIEKLGVFSFIVVLILRQWSTMFRATLFFTFLSLFAAYAAERRMKMKPLIIAGLILAVVFIGVNFIHLYLYHLTAGWDEPSLIASLGVFLAPHGHLYTLGAIVGTEASDVPHLEGRGMTENIFFFIPRSIWQSKLSSDLYGTVPVQEWAGLPTHYQMAVTGIGEMIAHFGYFGIVMMVLFGMLYGVFDSFVERSVELRAALFGVLLSRVLPDIGMGVSAICITIVCTALFLGQAYSVRWASAFIRWVSRGFARLGGRRVYRRNEIVPKGVGSV